MRYLSFISLFFFIFFVACDDKDALIKSAIDNDMASSADVVSIGRDDDDGVAKKWHIGGGLD